MSDWPDTERRIYPADMSAAVGLMEAQVRIDHFTSLLRRTLTIANSKRWRDRAGLAFEGHPIWDEVREALKNKSGC